MEYSEYNVASYGTKTLQRYYESYQTRVMNLE